MNHWGLWCLDSTSNDSVNTRTQNVSKDVCIQNKIHQTIFYITSKKLLMWKSPITYPIINQQRHGFRRRTFLNITFHKEEYDGTETETRL